MGLSASKQVNRVLGDSSEFNSVCESVYEECLDLAQHAYPGVRPYQLASASDRLHDSLSTVHRLPIINKWVSTPPTQFQIDQAFRAVNRHSSTIQEEGDASLGPSEFKAFAVELYSNAVISNAGGALIRRVPIGVAGIAGLGMATRAGKDLVGTAIGVYAIGVATSIYLSLGG